MGVDKLATSLGLPRGEASDLLDHYHEALPYVRDTMDYLSEQADELGYSETILGRKVSFDRWEPNEWREDAVMPLPRSQAVATWGFNIRKAGLYKATNYTIQGTAAELMKMAMVKLWEDGVLDVTGVPRMTIHDELDFNDKGGTDEAFLEVVRTMENAIPLDVPVIVDGEIGPNWADLKDIPRAV
jgi:DNA polymerase-1